VTKSFIAAKTLSISLTDAVNLSGLELDGCCEVVSELTDSCEVVTELDCCRMIVKKSFIAAKTLSISLADEPDSGVLETNDCCDKVGAVGSMIIYK
jgi:hypothetical protein